MSSTGTPTGRGLRVLGPAVVLLAVVLGCWAVVDQREEIGDALGELTWWAAPVSFLAGAAGVYAIFRSWASVVADHGIDLTRQQALRIYGVGQAGKYLPGSVWSVLTQAAMVREYGGSRARMGAASLVALLLSVTVALGLGGLVLPVANPEAAGRYWFAPVLALLLATLLAPPVLNRAIAVVARVLRRPTDAVRVTGSGIVRASGWAVLGNAFFGLHLLVLGEGVGLSGFRGFLLAVAAYSLAAGLGVLVVLAPAGVGVREVVIVVVLAMTTTAGAALTIALLSRILLLVIDLLLALTQVRRPGAARERSTVFVTRRFPPSVGGMETLADGVWRSISQARPDSVLIAHGGTNRGLLLWLPLAWLRLAALAVRGRVGLILVGDAPTYAALRPLRPLLRVIGVRSAVMVMGLDVTYENRLYRRLVPTALRRADLVIAISEATRQATIGAGVDADRIAVLRLGVDPPDQRVDAAVSRARVERSIGLDPEQVLVVTLGRLVARKGVRWFVAEVLPGLGPDVQYVVAGDGPELEPIRAAAAASGGAARVHLLGRVDDQMREDLLAACDLFVQPNIAVPGDMEGFGLVTIEAAMRDALVVAADLEGIKDAVLPGRTGILVRSGDVAAWTSTLTSLVADRPAMARAGASFGVAARALYNEKSMAVELCRLLGIEAGRTDQSQHA